MQSFSSLQFLQCLQPLLSLLLAASAVCTWQIALHRNASAAAAAVSIACLCAFLCNVLLAQRQKSRERKKENRRNCAEERRNTNLTSNDWCLWVAKLGGGNKVRAWHVLASARSACDSWAAYTAFTCSIPCSLHILLAPFPAFSLSLSTGKRRTCSRRRMSLNSIDGKNNPLAVCSLFLPQMQNQSFFSSSSSSKLISSSLAILHFCISIKSV